MFKNKFFLCTLLLFIWVPFLFSQDARIDLLDRGIGTYQDIFVSDLDFLNLGKAKDLFAISLQKNITGQLQGRIEIILIKEGTELISIVTNQFEFPNDPGGPWIFTNVELSQGSFNFNSQGDAIRIHETNENEDQSQKLIDELKATNKIPFGVYRLIAKLNLYSNSNGLPIDEQTAEREIIINITNPYIISSISPGNLLNSGYLYELFSLNPVFQWNGNSGNYEVVVFKKQSDFSSPEDILSSQPVWQSDRISTLFTQYPEVGAVPLEYNQQYVWQVRSYIETSGGEKVVQSELFEFTVVDPSIPGKSRQSMAQQEFEELLRQFLGDEAEPIIRELSNFKLSIIRVNGEILSLPAFYKVLEKYRDQKNEIYDIFLRSSN